MTRENKSGYPLNRRTVLHYVIPGVCTAIAGCGEAEQERRGDRSERTSIESMNSRGEDRPDTVDEIVKDIQEIYDRISQFPIVRENEFVFEVRTFEDEFHYRELFDKVDSAKARLKDLELDDESVSWKPDLLQVTEVAENLIRQRIVVHQIIATGITFEESFSKGEYERAAEAIRDGIFFLNSLSDNRDEIISQVTQGDTQISLVEAYDAESIRETQVVLGEILRWTSPTYIGLYETVQGLQKFEVGNSALNNEEFGNAGGAYREAEDRFRSAEDAFDRAQGRGRRLPQIAPFVEGVRCMLPAYQTSSNELQKSMDEFDAGNYSRAREIGREAIISTKRVAQRCI